MLPRSQRRDSSRDFITILTIQLQFYNFDCFMISAESFEVKKKKREIERQASFTHRDCPALTM